MVDLVSISNHKHSESLESEALKASDPSTEFQNVDRILGISSLKNMVNKSNFTKETYAHIVSPETLNSVNISTDNANKQYLASSLDSYEQIMQYHTERSQSLLNKIKLNPKAEALFEKINELCKEHSTVNVIELMAQKFHEPEVNKVITQVNTLIKNDSDIKKDFDEFQNEYSNFTSAQYMYKQELVDQLQNDQLNTFEREAILQHSSDRVNIINSDFNNVLESGKNIPVYNQSQDYDSPMISDQHKQLTLNTKSEFDDLKDKVAESNVRHKNQNQLSM
jgi:hypothetical protein